MNIRKKHFMMLKFITVACCFLVLTNCVTTKKASGLKSIYGNAVLVNCELFTSNKGIWITGLEKVICLMPEDRYYEKSDFIANIPTGSVIKLRKEIVSGGGDAATSVSYKVDVLNDKVLFATNVYVQDYYFDDLFKSTNID